MQSGLCWFTTTKGKVVEKYLFRKSELFSRRKQL